MIPRRLFASFTPVCLNNAIPCASGTNRRGVDPSLLVPGFTPTVANTQPAGVHRRHRAELGRHRERHGAVQRGLLQRRIQEPRAAVGTTLRFRLRRAGRRQDDRSRRRRHFLRPYPGQRCLRPDAEPAGHSVAGPTIRPSAGHHTGPVRSVRPLDHLRVRPGGTHPDRLQHESERPAQHRL